MKLNNKLKIGLFGINSNSGLSLTKHKKRWKADWNEIKKLIIYCDRNNFDFILPLRNQNRQVCQKHLTTQLIEHSGVYRVCRFSTY